MKKPKRYNCGNGEGMFEDDNGFWVEYSEHKAIVEALTEQLRKHAVMREFHCERFDFGRDKKCEQQCSDCYWMQTKLHQSNVVEQSEQLSLFKCPNCGNDWDIEKVNSCECGASVRR